MMSLGKQSTSRLPADLLTVARATLGATLGQSAAEVTAQLARVGDWRSTSELLRQHGLTPLAYWALRSLYGDKPPMIPEQEWSTWHEAYLTTAARQLLAQAQLAELIEASGLPGERIMALKGFWLARHVYPDPGTRPMSDLDVAVRLDDLDLLLGALPNLGYRPLSGRAFYGDVEYWRWRARHLAIANIGNWVKWRRRPIANVDVHTDLWPNDYWLAWTAPRPDGWMNAKVVQTDSGKLSAPAPGLALLHLCYHNCWHALLGAWRLLADIDIALLLEKEAANWSWEELLAQAREYEILPAVYFALASARQSLGAPVPDNVLAAAKPTATTQALVWLFRHLWLPGRRHVALVTRCFIQSPHQRLRFLTVGPWHTTLLAGHFLARRAGLVRGDTALGLDKEPVNAD